jgi:hypothetical protein
MPTTTPVVLRALVDDAAVFPPGNAPLAEAVAGHAVHRRAWYAGCVGPLLVPAASVADLVRVLDLRDAVAVPGVVADPVALVLVARPGADPHTTTTALDALRDDIRVRVTGVELGWQQGWRELGLDDVTVALEVPRGPDHEVAVADVRSALAQGWPVVAKFRTGPTATWAWPDEAELASFLRLVAPEVPFKLTGGLHHAVRGTYEVVGVPEENHGVLNVLVATSAALAHAGQDEVAALLAVRDATALAELVAAWPDDTATRVRTAFTAYGCCTVTDPVGELADLGLLARP